jgi:hypothetical protein
LTARSIFGGDGDGEARVDKANSLSVRELRFVSRNEGDTADKADEHPHPHC